MGQLLFSAGLNYKIRIDYFDFSSQLEQRFFERSGKKLTEISFASMDLFHDIVTCGMPWHYINRRCNMKRSEEIKYKLYLMRAALEVDGGYIVVSDNMKYLDSSERAFISYYIGMFITKLISREIFGYDYLVHLGIVEHYKKVIRGSKEPDLVGFKRKSDKYSLFESKGRQTVKLSMINKAKDQLRSVSYISGIKPDFGIVCVAHPIKEGSSVICSMYDPPLDENVKMQVYQVHKEELFYLYYLPIYEIIREKGNGEAYCNFSFYENGEHEIKIYIEMPKKLFDLFTENPDFYEWNDNNFKIKETISLLPENEKGDLLKIEI